MSSRVSLMVDGAQIRRIRLFYVGMSAAMVLVVLIGFAPSFYLRTQLGGAPLATPWVLAHAIANSAWMLLMLAQTGLVAGGRSDLHRRLGVAGALLAVAMVMLGLYVGIDYIARNSTVLLSGGAVAERLFLCASLIGIVKFGGFVTAAVLLRGRPSAHRVLMLFATITVMSAATVRLPVIGTLPAAVALVLVAFNGSALAYDIYLNKGLRPAAGWAFGLTLLVLALVNVLAPSTAFDSFIRWVGEASR